VDVQQIPLQTHWDDRGYLFEVLRKTDPHFTEFGQVYVVGSLGRGTIRAFHRHFELWDWFCIVRGSAKFITFDPDVSNLQQPKSWVLSEKNPSLLVVPPGVFHGWMALEEHTILLSTGSHVYNREKPDEQRVSYDSFEVDWSVKPK